MATVAIVGVLVTVAVLQLRPSEYSGSVIGLADQIASLGDQARMRAMSSQRIQRLQFDADQIVHLQATETGLKNPDEWEEIGRIVIPSNIEIVATSDRVHLDANDEVPAEGEGIGEAVDFSPDGSAKAITVFIGDTARRKLGRVAFYGATGSARVFEAW